MGSSDDKVVLAAEDWPPGATTNLCYLRSDASVIERADALEGV